MKLRAEHQQAIWRKLTAPGSKASNKSQGQTLIVEKDNFSDEAIRLDETEGVGWELSYLFEAAPLDRLIVFLSKPDGMPMDRETYAAYFEAMAPDIRRFFPIPESVTRGRFIYFRRPPNAEESGERPYDTYLVEDPENERTGLGGFRRSLEALQSTYLETVNGHPPTAPRYTPIVPMVAKWLAYVSPVALLTTLSAVRLSTNL